MTARVMELIGVEHAVGGLGKETPPADRDDQPDGDVASGAPHDDGPQAESTQGHCGLCGLTDDEKAWNAAGDELGVPTRLHASDELAPEEQQVVREVGTPCVLARLDNTDLRPVVLAERLEVFEGDVTRLVREVRLVAEQQGWSLPAACAEDTDQPEAQTI